MGENSRASIFVLSRSKKIDSLITEEAGVTKRLKEEFKKWEMNG